MKKVLAFVPARIGSQGIKQKNLQELAGRKLYEIPILQAKKSRFINHILLSTDGDAIKADAQKHAITIHDRPEAYRHDNSTQEVDRLMLHALKQYESETNARMDAVVLLYPTGPLRTVAQIDQCIDMVLEGAFDSSLTLVEDSSYLWKIQPDGSALPTNYVPEERGPRQKEHWNQYVENKAVYVAERDMFLQTGCRIGRKCGYVLMDKMASVDIDAPEDLDLARIVADSFRKLDL